MLTSLHACLHWVFSMSKLFEILRPQTGLETRKDFAPLQLLQNMVDLLVLLIPWLASLTSSLHFILLREVLEF